MTRISALDVTDVRFPTSLDLDGSDAMNPEPDYSAAFRALALRQRKRALIVLLTDVIDGRAARSLLAHLSRGAAKEIA